MGGVVKAVTNVVKAVGKVVSGVVSAIGSVVSSVINFVASPFMGLFGMPDVPSNDSESSRITGVLVQKTGTNVNVPVVYGFRQVAGTVVFAETGADNNKYLWVAYVISEGPVEGVRSIRINDIEVPASNIPNLNSQTAVVISGKDSNGKDSQLNGITTLLFYKGAYVANPTTDTNLGSVIKNGIFAGSPSFKTSMVYNGLCTVFARYEWKESTDTWTNPFSGGIPELKVAILGKKVARLTTRNADGSPRDERVTGSACPELYNWGQYGAGYAEGYSTNPAEILLDYLRNPMYGKGLTNNDIDWESFYVAAVKCNQSIDYTTTVQGPILTLNYVLDTGQTIFNNVKLLLQNFRAYLPYSRGQYFLRIEDAGDPYDILSGAADIVASFDKDNIQGSITYTGIERSNKYNQVVVKYVDPDNFWSEQTVVYPESQQERWDYQTIDGGRENKGEFTFAGITNYMIAKDMARLLFNKSRYQDSLSFTVSSQGFELEPGDNIYVNGNMLQFGDDPLQNAIPWRIISMKLNNDMTFDLGCVRNPDFIYPHVRAGEIDHKFAVYVPRGASRWYPIEPTLPIGIVPPWTTPTDPNDPGNPPSGPGVPPANDIISFYNIQSVLRGTYAFLNMRFLQPTNPAYASTFVRYKQDLASVTSWVEMTFTQRPGANLPVDIELGPLQDNTQYIIESRVRYTDGSQSNQTSTTRIYVNTSQQGGGGGGGGGGGTPTPPPAPPVNLAEDFLAYAVGNAALSGGLPLNPRRVDFVLRQDMRSGVNPYLNSLEIFYKKSTDSGWTRTTQTLANTQGSDIAFSLTLGNRLYPLVPGSGGIPGNVDDYDFIFRFTYSDGKTSKYQYRAMNRGVEYGNYGYVLQVLATDQPGQLFTKELCTDYVPVLASSGTLTDYRNITDYLQAYGMYASRTSQDINFWLSQPLDSSGSVIGAAIPYFAGYRVHRREVIEGASIATSPILQYDNNTPFTINNNVYVNGVAKVAYGAVVQNQTWDVVYDWVIVPLVWYNNQITAATNCFKWRGKVHNRENEYQGPNPYPQAPNLGNWWAASMPQVVNYQEALASLSAPYPATDPTPRLQSIVRVEPSASSNHGYFTLRFQVPSTFASMKVYRRSAANIKESPYSYFWQPANLAGVGQWEYITPSGSQYSIDSNQVITLNVRPAVSGRREFNNQFRADLAPTTNAPGSQSTNALYGGYTSVEPASKSLVGFALGGTPLYGSPSEITQVLIVLTTTTQSAKGLLIDLKYNGTPDVLLDAQVVDFTSSTSSTSTVVNPVAAPVVGINASNLNTMKRTISEARTTSSLSSAIKTGLYQSTNYVAPTATPPVI